MAVELFTAPAAGGELHGRMEGEGPPVLALHGGPGLSFDYLDGMVHELAAGYRVATYQQRGLEPSTTGGPFSVPQEVADACSVLDALQWERAWVVGHSWGGHLVLHLALARPDRLVGGLAVDPLGAIGNGGMSAARERFAAWLARGGDAAPLVTEEPGDGLIEGLRAIWPAYFAEPELAGPMPPIRGSQAANAGIWASIAEEMPRLAAGLGELSVPIGFLAGAGSPPRGRRSGRPTAAAIPGAWLEVVEGAGHFPWVERPGSVRAALDRLVAGAR